MLPVFQISTFPVKPKHVLLGLVQCFIAVWIICRGIFEAFAEAQLEKFGRQFVVLFVGGLGFDGDRAAFEFGDQGIETRIRRAAVQKAFIKQTLPAKTADALAEKCIGQQPALG